MSTSAVFLFVVSASTHGYTNINAIPMPSMEVCEKAITFIDTDIVQTRETLWFPDKTKFNINSPILMKCKDLG